MSLMTCPRCLSPVVDCVCPEWHAQKIRTPDVSVPAEFEGDDPPRLLDAPTTPAVREAIELLSDPDARAMQLIEESFAKVMENLRRELPIILHGEVRKGGRKGRV